MIKGMLQAAVVLMAVLATEMAGAQDCGNLNIPGQYGPFDYRTVSQEDLVRVEAYHFTSDIAQASAARKDLPEQYDFVLRAFPNHSRALLNLIKVWDREGRKPQMRGMRWNIECYFERAIRFQPNDISVRWIYASFLAKAGRKEEAIRHLAVADAGSSSGSGNEFYNIGLVFFDAGDFGKALEYAHRADRAGFKLPGLRNKLTAAGKWRDPVVVPQTSEKPALNEAASSVSNLGERRGPIQQRFDANMSSD